MKKFEEISDALDKSTAEKNEVYGDAYSKSYEVFGATYAAIEVFNKVNQTVTLTKNSLSEANNEPLLDSYVDLRSYAEPATQHIFLNTSDENKAKYGL